jgi:hypothetical protein
VRWPNWTSADRASATIPISLDLDDLLHRIRLQAIVAGHELCVTARQMTPSLHDFEPRAAVGAYRGSIALDSQPGRGAAFCAALPRLPSVPVIVMKIRRVLVLVLDVLVAMEVGVLTDAWRIMHVVVMAIVVPVGVLVLDRFMNVAMAVALGDVEPDSQDKGQSAQGSARPGQAISDEPRNQRPHKRADGKHRSGARRAHAPLSEQVEP